MSAARQKQGEATTKTIDPQLLLELLELRKAHGVSQTHPLATDGREPSSRPRASSGSAGC